MLLAQVEMTELGAQAKALVLRYGISAAGALLLLAIAWFLSGWVGRILERSMTRAKIDATLTRFLARLVGWLILLLAILACLSIFGVETTSFAAVLGAAGIAIGLAFQGTLSNFASGLMLLVFRPFQVGDVISVAGITGKVYAIEIFTTTIDSFDNRRYIVPNGSVFGTTIENITFHPERRVEVTVGVGYQADLDQTRSVLESAVAQVEDILPQPAPNVVLNGVGATSVDWTIWVWVKSADFLKVKQALLRATKNALDAAQIDISVPQMAVHLRQPQGDVPGR